MIKIRNAVEMAESLPVIAGVEMTDCVCVVYPDGSGDGGAVISRVPVLSEEALEEGRGRRLVPPVLAESDDPVDAVVVAYSERLSVDATVAFVVAALACEGVTVVSAYLVRGGAVHDLLNPSADPEPLQELSTPVVSLRLSGHRHPEPQSALRERVKPTERAGTMATLCEALVNRWEPEMGLRAAASVMTSRRSVADLPDSLVGLAGVALYREDTRHGASARDAVLTALTPGFGPDWTHYPPVMREVLQDCLVTEDNLNRSPRVLPMLDRCMEMCGALPEQFAADWAAAGAVLAWWGGYGVHARVLVERGLQATPSHSLCDLVSQMLDSGMTPRPR